VNASMQREQARPQRSRPRSISVVIPAYNAAATLAEQLQGLATQQYEGDWEVVIVDNGSTDGTAEVARRYSQRFNAFAVIDGGRQRGHSAPRNAGAAAARGEFLAFCDADDVVAPGWLLAMADAARHFDLVGGWLDVRPLNDDSTRSWHTPWPTDRLRSWLLPYAVSANFAIWADVLRDLHGWSTNYEAGGEDVELSWRAQLAGYRLGFAPDAVVYYRYRSSLRQTARQAYAIGVGCEKILGDFAFLRDGTHNGDENSASDQAIDGRGNTSRRALRRAAWLVTRLPYLAGSRRHRGLWISVAAEYLGRLSGAARYRVLDTRRRRWRHATASPARPASRESDNRTQAGARMREAILWVTRDGTAPHPYLVESCRRAGTSVRELRWAEEHDGRRPMGRFVELGRGRKRRRYSMSVKLVSPRLLAMFTRAPEDVVIVYELGLVGLYAGLSKALRPRRLISLVEGDYRHLGRTGTAAVKVALRRLAAKSIDVFIANNAPARDYLINTLKVPESKIVTGWWLAGLPADLTARRPANAATVPNGTPLFVCAGQLAPRKGVDLLLEALAVYRRQVGPCMLWVIGEGPQRAALGELARRLGIQDSVAFLGSVDPAGLKGALEACDALVFPTLQDLVGRVVVEALTVGVPVVVSPMTGAAGTIVLDGVDGLVVDPRDRQALARALARVADPAWHGPLREGARRIGAALTPDAVAAVILRSVALTRGMSGRLPVPSPTEAAALSRGGRG
jgi:glycosyltransferase involved in cell wall biosynthesis